MPASPWNGNRSAEAGKLLASEVPTLDRILAQMKRLTAPAADRASFAQYLDLARRQIDLQRRLAADLQAADYGDATKATAQLNAAAVRQAKLAAAVCAPSCKTRGAPRSPVRH